MKPLYRIAVVIIIVAFLLCIIRFKNLNASNVYANGSVAIDGPVSFDSYTGNLSLSHTSGVGENRILLVGVSWGRTSIGSIARNINSITFNSVELEIVIESKQDPMNCVAIYRFPGEAPIGISAEVAISFSSTNVNATVGAINFSGVDLSNPFGSVITEREDFGNPTANMSTHSGSLVFDTISTLYTAGLTISPNANQTEQWQSYTDNGITKLGAASIMTTTSTTTTMGWVPEYPYEPWAMAAVSIQPAQQSIPGIGDFVWIDQNGDGIQDEGEPGLPEVVVDLIQNGGSDPTLTAVTNPEGFYFFDNPPTANYFLKFTHPTIDLEFTLKNQGPDETTDSDTNPSGVTSIFSYTAGTNNMSLDAGVLMPDNPSLFQTCGLDIALVIDSSINTDDNLDTIKTAFQNFTSNLLPATPTRIALIDYDSTARVWDFDTNQWADFVEVDDGNYWSKDLTSIHTALGTIQNDGGTNYDDALSNAHALFTLDREENPNLIIFSTLSQPDHFGSDGLPTSEADAFTPAVQNAFFTKSDRVRIISFGIGSGADPNKLSEISGFDVDSSLIIESDVVTTDFSMLLTKLELLTKDMCGGTCTVHNIIDEDGSLNYNAEGNIIPEETWITEGPALRDWEYHISNLEGSLSLDDTQINPAFTGIDGQALIDFDVFDAPASFDLQETLLIGFELLDVECIANGTHLSAIEVAGTSASGISFVDINDILACYFINHPTPSAVTLLSFIASYENDSVLLKWETASEIDNLGFNLYREDPETGRKEKINPELIPSQAPGGTTGAIYQFRDDDARFGERCAYWLESIDAKMREQEQFGPVNPLWWQFFLPIFSGSN